MNSGHSNEIPKSIVGEGISDLFADVQGNLFTPEERSELHENAINKGAVFLVRLPKGVMQSEMRELIETQLDEIYEKDLARLEAFRDKHKHQKLVHPPIDPRGKFFPEETHFSNNGWMAPDGTIHLAYWHDPGHDEYQANYLVDYVKMRSHGYSKSGAKYLAECNSLRTQGWIKLHRGSFKVFTWTAEQEAMMKLWQTVIPKTSIHDEEDRDGRGRATRVTIEETQRKIRDWTRFDETIKELERTPVYFHRFASRLDFERTIADRVGKGNLAEFKEQLADGRYSNPMVAIGPKGDTQFFFTKSFGYRRKKWDATQNDPLEENERYPEGTIFQNDEFYRQFHLSSHVLFELKRHKLTLDVQNECISDWCAKDAVLGDDLPDYPPSVFRPIEPTEEQLAAIGRWNAYFGPIQENAIRQDEMQWSSGTDDELPF